MRSLRFGLFLLLICLLFAGSASASLDSLIGSFGSSDTGPIKTKVIQKTSNAPSGSSGGLSSILFLIDVSGSMSGSKLESAKASAKNTIRKALNHNTEIAVLSFEGSHSDNPMNAVRVEHGFSTSESSLISAVNRLSTGGGTPLACAVIAANHYMATNKSPASVNQMILLLGDGDDSCGHLNQSLAQLKSSGKLFHHQTIGLGVGDNSQAIDQLNSIAKAAGGKFHQANSTNDLAKAFDNAYANRSMQDMIGGFGDNAANQNKAAQPAEKKEEKKKEEKKKEVKTVYRAFMLSSVSYGKKGTSERISGLPQYLAEKYNAVGNTWNMTNKRPVEIECPVFATDLQAEFPTIEEHLFFFGPMSFKTDDKYREFMALAREKVLLTARTSIPGRPVAFVSGAFDYERDKADPVQADVLRVIKRYFDNPKSNFPLFKRFVHVYEGNDCKLVSKDEQEGVAVLLPPSKFIKTAPFVLNTPLNLFQILQEKEKIPEPPFTYQLTIMPGYVKNNKLQFSISGVRTPTYGMVKENLQADFEVDLPALPEGYKIAELPVTGGPDVEPFKTVGYLDVKSDSLSFGGDVFLSQPRSVSMTEKIDPISPKGRIVLKTQPSTKFRAVGKSWYVGEYGLSYNETVTWVNGLSDGWRMPSQAEVFELWNEIRQSSPVIGANWVWADGISTVGFGQGQKHRGENNPNIRGNCLPVAVGPAHLTSNLPGKAPTGLVELRLEPFTLKIEAKK